MGGIVLTCFYCQFDSNPLTKYARDDIMKAVAPCNTTTFSHMRAKWSSRTSCAWPVEWKWSSCPSYSIYVLIFHLNTFISARNNINKENCNHLYLLVISRQIKVIKIYMIISGLNTGQNEWKIHSTIHISVCLRTRGVVWGCTRNQFWGFVFYKGEIYMSTNSSICLAHLVGPWKDTLKLP